MSAFIVSKAHIDALVAVALHGPSQYHARCWPAFTDYTPSDLGRALWTENLASVAYRYPGDVSGQRPSSGDTDEMIQAYTYMAHLGATRLTAVQALKAVQCLTYQSCEHDGWEASAAKRICETLTSALIGSLPGYEDAEWHIN